MIIRYRNGTWTIPRRHRSGAALSLRVEPCLLACRFLRTRTECPAAVSRRSGFRIIIEGSWAYEDRLASWLGIRPRFVQENE